MKGRLFAACVVLAMVAAACAEPGVVGGSDAVQESESVASDTGSYDGSVSDVAANEESVTDPDARSGDSPTGEGATSEKRAVDQDNETASTRVTSTTVEKTSSTTSAPVTPPDDTVPASVVNSAFVGVAIADLVERLGIDAAEIEVISVDEVTWRDGSIGCPQPGMSYTQALVNGTRIRLLAKGMVFEYHSAGGVDPFYCSNPEEPVAASGT